MKLPIDIVPNTNPPQFRWRQTVSSPVGTSVSECGGHLPPSLEKPVADLIAIVRDLGNRIEALSTENEKLLRQVEEVSAKLEQGKATLTTVANAPPDGKGISSKKVRG